MKRAVWAKFQRSTLDKVFDLTQKKNADYTGGTDDAFANFRGSTDFGVTPIIGLLLRMSDKFMRLRSWVSKGKLEVAGEGPEDALLDIIGYATVALGLVQEQKEVPVGDPTFGDLLAGWLKKAPAVAPWPWKTYKMPVCAPENLLSQTLEAYRKGGQWPYGKPLPTMEEARSAVEERKQRNDVWAQAYEKTRRLAAAAARFDDVAYIRTEIDKLIVSREEEQRRRYELTNDYRKTPNTPEGKKRRLDLSRSIEARHWREAQLSQEIKELWECLEQ